MATSRKIVEFGDAELRAAEQYLLCTKLEKESAALRADAKQQLLIALGDCNVGILPDGRTVRKSVSEFPEKIITRNAYRAVYLDID
jgi:hypothetical protein